MSHRSDDGRMVYLYCLTRSHEEVPFHLSVKGIGGRGDEVYSIPFLDLAMVVSDSPQDEYETTRANTMQHQLVCEEVLKQGFTVLPVRFGTVCKPTPGKSSAEGKIERLLRRRYGEFHSLLGEMENKVELGLKVFWKKKRLFQQIVAENQNIREMRDRIATNPSGGLSTHYGRLQIGTWVHNEIEKRRDIEARRLARALSPLAERYETNKVLTDTMILNAAFLVHQSRVGKFDAKVNELDARYNDSMTFRYVGPVPPFNFVELVVHWEEDED
ncbi:MAG: GvpL/GvpF family gas vesicle protein [Anaerolineae bacterium]|nr:GvpL/GvpF family gas vesicle protein [Anaerolineae bacterium]